MNYGDLKIGFDEYFTDAYFCQLDGKTTMIQSDWNSNENLISRWKYQRYGTSCQYSTRRIPVPTK